jgi:hypothetical protein
LPFNTQSIFPDTPTISLYFLDITLRDPKFFIMSQREGRPFVNSEAVYKPRIVLPKLPPKILLKPQGTLTNTEEYNRYLQEYDLFVRKSFFVTNSLIPLQVVTNPVGRNGLTRLIENGRVGEIFKNFIDHEFMPFFSFFKIKAETSIKLHNPTITDDQLGGKHQPTYRRPHDMSPT